MSARRPSERATYPRSGRLLAKADGGAAASPPSKKVARLPAPAPARGSGAEPRTHHRRSRGSRQTPSSNLAAAPRRRRGASPAGSAALNNGPPGRAQRRRVRATAAAARRAGGARLPGPSPGAGEPKGAGAPADHASRPLGPRRRGRARSALATSLSQAERLRLLLIGYCC
ncbi:serine/arginine repetitive matrix protein 3-like [Equus caballus]|uniref:serine/arginine repetitive matrix protein 3-like n=1 Tax=Equus caballus TaxID=9796 RepID=UPI0038B2F23E